MDSTAWTWLVGTLRGYPELAVFFALAAGFAVGSRKLAGFTLGNVTAVKAYILSRTLEPSRDYTDTKTYSMGLAGNVGPFDDKYKRHAYSVLISLPNRSGAREPQLAVAP